MTLKHNILITISMLVAITGFAVMAWWGSFLVFAGVVGTITGYKSAFKHDGIDSITDLLIDPEVLLSYYRRK